MELVVIGTVLLVALFLGYGAAGLLRTVGIPERVTCPKTNEEVEIIVSGDPDDVERRVIVSVNPDSHADCDACQSLVLGEHH